MNPADAMRARLRGDLADAMAERKGRSVGILRALIGAIDNAEAVPVDTRGPYRERAFGDASGEVPRKALGADEVRAIIEADAAEREAAASVLSAGGRSDRAAELAAEAQLVRSYLAG